MDFNKKFDEIFQAKEGEMRRIGERNTRIRKIMRDLEINDDLFDPHWTSDEKPEVLLTVNDDEVKVEKYISEEERKNLEELAKKDEGTRVCFLQLGP